MNQHDNLTNTLTQELGERAHTMDGSTLHLTDIQGRARSIRRRRTATTVAGLAAALAVIVPTAALATRNGGHPTPGPATQNPSPTQTATPDSSRQPKPGVLDVSDLPTGAEPGLEYVTGGSVLHAADGTTADVGTRYPVSSFVVVSDGARVWQTTDEGTPYVELQDADGTYHAPVRSQGGLAVNSQHTIAAWVMPSGQVMVWSGGGSDPTALGTPITAGNELQIAAVVGDDCSLACSIDVNVFNGNDEPQPWEVSANGTQPLQDGDYLTIADVSDAGLSIGYRSITDFGTCSALLGGGEFQGFSTCKNTLASFSPDGRLILADPAYHDGIGHGVIGMYDLGGQLLWDRRSTEQTQSFYPKAQWEDATHVLAPVYQNGRWSIVRFASDGSMEYAVAPIPGEDLRNPYVLAAD
jgi:hypothetical protein